MGVNFMNDPLEIKMEETDMEETNSRINRKLRLNFDGKIVRKDLTEGVE